MIPAGHEHVWQPYNVADLGNGRRQIDSRCQCANMTDTDMGTVIEQRIVVDESGQVLALTFRFGGLWFSPLDLLRIRPSTSQGDLDYCPTCGGRPPKITGMPPCSTCAGLGVTVDGAAVTAPQLSAY